MNCDQVFDILTRGPFPTGTSCDTPVEAHLNTCAECRRLAEALRPALGAHVYGCDVCQDVCPYNRPAPVSTDPHWQPRPGLDLPALAELWSRPDGEWRRAIEGTPMTRAKVAGLRRNVAVALGNSGDASSVAALTAGGDDRASVMTPGVQHHVAWARERLET